MSEGTDSAGAPARLSDEPNAVVPLVSKDVSDRRRLIGYVLMFASIVGMLATVVYCVFSLEALEPTKGGQAVFDYLKLVVHGIATVTVVLFFYGLLQVAERLALPTELVRSYADVRLLLGVKTPIDRISSNALDAVKVIANAVRSNGPGN